MSRGLTHYDLQLAFDIGRLINQLDWHMEKGLLVGINDDDRNEILRATRELELIAVAWLPQDLEDTTKQRLQTFRMAVQPSSEADGQDAEELGQLYDELRDWCCANSYQGPIPNEVINRVFSSRFQVLRHHKQVVRELFNSVIQNSEPQLLACKLGISIDQLLRPPDPHRHLFVLEPLASFWINKHYHRAYLKECRRERRPAELGKGFPLSSPKGPDYGVVVAKCKPGMWRPPKTLEDEIAIRWARLGLHPPFPGRFMRIVESSSLSELRVNWLVTKLETAAKAGMRNLLCPAGVNESNEPVTALRLLITPSEYTRLRKVKDDMTKEGEYIGESIAILRVFETIKLLNQNSDKPVVILGETGVGKTEIAELIHDNSCRRGPFHIEQASGSKQGDPSLMMSRWVGHEKSSGLATVPREGTPGLLEDNKGGTILVDELAYLAPDFQLFLLHVLDGRPIAKKSAKGNTIVPDVRLLFATNHNFDDAIKKETIRHDLARRIQSFKIESPPLRDRKDDIFHFVSAKCSGYKPTDGFWLALLRYSWPGNVGGLLDVLGMAVNRAQAAGRKKKLTVDDLELQGDSSVVRGVQKIPADKQREEVYGTLADILRQQGLETGGGLQQRMSALLGVSTATVSRELSKQPAE